MPISDYTPELADVARLMPARTQGDADVGGEEQGTFNTHTNPTGAEVADLIERAAQVVSLDIGVTIDEAYHDIAKTLVSLLTAAWIERGYTPEQATEAQSPYEQYMREYRELLAKLLAVLAGDPAETANGIVSVPIVSPLYALAESEADEE